MHQNEKNPGTSFISPQACETMALVHGILFYAHAGFTRLHIEGEWVMHSVFLLLWIHPLKISLLMKV